MPPAQFKAPVVAPPLGAVGGRFQVPVTVRPRMSRTVSLLVLLGGLCPVQADDKNVTLTFLGGAKKTPLEGLKVTIRRETGDWTADQKNKVADGKTDKDGTAGFTLADGRYYVDLASDKEVPYLQLPAGYKGHPHHFSRRITVGTETSFEFNLADACKLTLRAVDADTGKGLPGVVFVTENELAEDWASPINGDNLGAKRITENWTDDTLKTDKSGNFVRFIGPRPGYTYYVWTAPPGYEVPARRGEVTLESPLGTEKAEHAFKFKKKQVVSPRSLHDRECTWKTTSGHWAITLKSRLHKDGGTPPNT